MTGASETCAGLLETYLALLTKWQKAINLVGANTLDDPWRRHMLDSAQLLRFMPDTARQVVDLGSGAGFPGMVLAILGGGLDVHLVESDGRKCAFLAEVKRVVGCRVTVHNKRVEDLDGPTPDVVTARALAPLSRILESAEKLFNINTLCLFLKGRTVERELTDCEKTWNMVTVCHPSLSDMDGKVVEMKRISRHHG